MQTRVVSMRYDAAQGAYEARVDIEREGRVFRYPCRLVAPESAPRAWLEDALTRQAFRMSASDRPQRAPAAGPGLLRRLTEALSRVTAVRPAPTGLPVRTTDPVRPRTQLH